MSLDYWSNIILLFYIFSMPFVSAFAFTNIISFSLIFAVLLLLLMLISILKAAKLPPGFLGFDLLIILLFLFNVTFSYSMNGWGNAKSFNHTVAYFATFSLFYIPVKFTLFNITDTNKVFKNVLRMITYTITISAVYANVEFISSNLFGINLNDYIPRPNDDQTFYNATVLGVFYRARGFAVESGHFTFMMELFSPLSIYYMYFSGFCKWRKVIKLMIVLIVISSFIFAVSTASFVIIPIAVTLASLINIRPIVGYIKKHTTRFLLTAAVVSTAVLVFNYFFSIYALIILSISEKVDYGLDYRQANIAFFFKKFFQFDITQQIIGAGPAGILILGYDLNNAILNLYYSITFELGFLGVFLFISLLFYFIFHFVTLKSKISFFLLISIFAGMMHYYFISNFWYPWFWFVAAFGIFCCKKIFTISQK